MRIRRILAEAAIVAAGTLFWLAVTAFVGLPSREEPPQAEAAGQAGPLSQPLSETSPQPATGLVLLRHGDLFLRRP
jgi:hypothetical protein